MPKTPLGKSLSRYLSQPNVNEQVTAYLAPGRYSGAMFDRLADGRDPNRFTERDFLAVSTLSVTVPPDVRNWLLTNKGAEYTFELLREIPCGATIADDTDHLAKGTAAWELWYLLRTAHNMGGTTISKLMAVKRPHLMPIHDSVVSAALKLRLRHSWSSWRDFMTKDWPDQSVSLKKAVSAAGGDHLTALRVIDITVWMTAMSERSRPVVKPSKPLTPDRALLKPAHKRTAQS
jgi:hypothetical protein